MSTRIMRVDWQSPVTLHILPEVTDPQASQLRRSADGVVQLLAGAGVAVTVRLRDASGFVAAAPGQVLQHVSALELDDAPELDGAAALDQASVEDDTVVSSESINASVDATISLMTRQGNDVDDTIIGQPAIDATAKAAPDDDADADADTVIGSQRKPATAIDEAPADRDLPVVLPPLPVMPGIPANINTDIPARVRDGASGSNSIVLSDGRVVALDGPVYVGRSPRSPRITSGRAPELVAVSSPRREVSATHLELQQHGIAVVVRDLGSTNGTRVSVPGAAPSVLSPGSSRVVAAGTRLDLGDGVVLEIVANTGGPQW